MNPRWSAPNWCDPCGGYRSRGHECVRQQQRNPGGSDDVLARLDSIDAT